MAQRTVGSDRKHRDNAWQGDGPCHVERMVNDDGLVVGPTKKLTDYIVVLPDLLIIINTSDVSGDFAMERLIFPEVPFPYEYPLS